MKNLFLCILVLGSYASGQQGQDLSIPTTVINGGTLTVQSLAVTPAASTVVLGQTAQYNCIPTLVDALGNVTVGSTPITAQASWSSLNPLVAAVNANGMVTGVSGGSTTIKCADGGLTGLTTVTVLAAPNWSTVTLANGSNGVAYNFSVVPFVSGGVGAYTFSCPATCNMPGWLSFSAGGLFTGTAATGVTTFTIRVCDTVPSCANTSVTLSVIAGGSGPPAFTGSTTSQLAQNLVAGCNSNVPSALCGAATATFSITSNIVTINVANTFAAGSGAGACTFGTTCGSIIAISGCTVATYLNGQIIGANSSTTSSAIVGPLINVDLTGFTHADAGSTPETKCYLQGQGWQPFYLAPFPAPGSTNCTLGNGSVGCATGSMINTWAFDWSVPGASKDTPPNDCMVIMSDSTFDGTREREPAASGETNDPNVSLDDGASGYFFGMTYGGNTGIAHGHINPTLCNGKPGFVQDVLSAAGLWSTIGSNYGAMSRLTRPGANQAKWYTVDYTTSNYAPVLKSYILTYAAGAVTASAPTTLYNISSCPGFKYVTIGALGLINQETQFSVDASDNHIYFGLGSGNQGLPGRHMVFDISLTGNTCANWDTEGFSGTGLYSWAFHGGAQGTGYAVGDQVNLSENFGGGFTCINILTVQSVDAAHGNKVVTLSNTSGGLGCALAQGPTTVLTSTRTGTGTGLVLDVSGIGTPGTFHTVYTANNPTPVTTTVQVYGIHSGAMEHSGGFAYTSGGGSGGAEWVLGTSTLQVSSNPNTRGHPGIGFQYAGAGSFPNYLVQKYSDFSVTTLFTVNPACTLGGQMHSSIATPLNDMSYPFLISTSVNTAGSVRTDPPGWTCGLMQSVWAIDQLSVPRWFAHAYDNTANTQESFQSLNGIWEMSQDEKFLIFKSDQNNGFIGNTGCGTALNTQPLGCMVSIMLQ